MVDGSRCFAKTPKMQYEMAKSTLSFDCTTGVIQKMLHGLLRPRLPAVDMKKEDLPRELKQKAYNIGRQKVD